MFRTEININGINPKITLKSNLMFFGSCFTENIGAKISNLYINNTINPFGILYNPASVAKNLKILLDNKKFSEQDLVFYNNKWISFNHHGKFSNKNKLKTLENINTEINNSANLLKEIDFLFITFGTAWVYKLIENNNIVANCHKLPASNFTRKRLAVSDITTEYNKLIENLKTINPKLTVIFTVSPIRHWKDGANGNQLSKSILLLAISEIVEQNKNALYFPSYEIVMDDLRDYRFYTSDMLHINETAINYIWDKFKQCFFDKSLLDYEKKINKINKAVNHKVDDKYDNDYLNFMKTTIKKIENLEKEYKINLPLLLKDRKNKLY